MRLLLFILVLATAFPAFAGSLGMKNIGPYTRWESDCSKPDKPSFNVDNIDSYNLAVEEFNSYINEVNAYIKCVQNEAKADAEILQKVLKEGAKEAIDDISSEATSVRSDLHKNKDLAE